MSRNSVSVDENLMVLARIREIVGDPEGKLMQDELVARVSDLRNVTLEEAAQICDKRERRADTKSARACYRLCAADIRGLIA